MGESCIRRLDIERFCAGELNGPAAAALTEHFRTCASCSAYSVKLQKERETFLRIHPFAEFIAARGEEKRTEPWYGKLAAALPFPALRPVLVPALCVLLVAITVVPFIARQGGREAGSSIRYKGPQILTYIYKRDGAVHKAAPQDLFRGGDQVQVFYTAGKAQYISLFSIDSASAVSFYQPAVHSALCSIRSGTGAQCAYPKSIELDSTPGAELVVAVFSDTPFDTNQIKQWVAGFKRAGDMTALENAVKNNPPTAKSTVQTLRLLKKG
jgi:hypothetical protein